MKLRLLPRKEIDALKARERQSEISEGAKLAKRVDGLRVLQAEEEAHLNKWRIETLAEIEQEIAKKEKERLLVETHLLNKRKELKNALIPLREKERFLEKEQKRLEISLIEVEVQKSELGRVINENEALIKLNAKELAKRSAEHYENDKLFAEASNELREAEEILSAAKQEATSLRDSAKVIQARAAKCENEAIKWERELQLKANVLSLKEAELEQRELDVIVKELLFNSPIKYGGQHNNANIS